MRDERESRRGKEGEGRGHRGKHKNKNGTGRMLEYSCVQSLSPWKACESHKSHDFECLKNFSYQGIMNVQVCLIGINMF